MAAFQIYNLAHDGPGGNGERTVRGHRLADNLQPHLYPHRRQFGTNTLGMLAFNSAFGSTEDLGLGAAVTVVLLVVAVCIAVPLAMVLRYRERRLLT